MLTQKRWLRISNILLKKKNYLQLVVQIYLHQLKTLKRKLSKIKLPFVTLNNFIKSKSLRFTDFLPCNLCVKRLLKCRWYG